MSSLSAQHGATPGGHGGYDPMRFKLRTQKNDEQMITFIIAIATLAAAFILLPAVRALTTPTYPASALTKFSRLVNSVQRHTAVESADTFVKGC